MLFQVAVSIVYLGMGLVRFTLLVSLFCPVHDILQKFFWCCETLNLIKQTYKQTFGQNGLPQVSIL